MAARSTGTRDATRSVEQPLRDGGPGAVVRRAPFSSNPQVGARGQRTQQRILDAALAVFGEEGYHQGSIDRITKRAGCSRVSFYQYFSSKEDVFGHLAGRIARQLSAATEALDPLTPGVDGWAALRAWVGRYAETYERYEPVFHAMPAAAERDDAIAALAARTYEQNVARIRSRITTTTLPHRQLDSVIRLMLACLTHTLDEVGILRSAATSAYPKARVEQALTDVMHRTLFGLRPDVNVHQPGGPEPPALRFTPTMRELLQRDDRFPDPIPIERRALVALLASSRDVFVRRGYHNTRVDDLVESAGVSHGAFYRYFENKNHLARILAAGAFQKVSSAFVEIPQLSPPDGSRGKAALRRWLRRYNATQASEAAMVRVWLDASLHDSELRADSAAALDWGRRRMAACLRPRGYGDIDMDAVILVALLAVFGAEPRPAPAVEAAALIIERGLLDAAARASVSGDGKASGAMGR